ncbi:Alpha/Beta hydrolase protein [Corynascus novoguineensis]|uniref:Alpha/Beta hydrolase protein n=1 Tax=Corynascus novoguineensis TaxID=1126955 RepID=A0AAN7CPU4_9PEZI|nr:Alpha/Beta hydrolase protein [Corynascus novoguineensis]
MAPKTPLPKVPTVAETLKHPAYATATWDLVPDRKGLVPVAEGRGGPFKISWEIHGVGPTKIMFIMGLGGFRSAWQRQTLHFGHERRDQYSVLLIDNRGMGDSDKPLMRYSTSDMALDIAEVLASPEVGWLPSWPLPPSPSAPARTLHVVSISMGGMIAQELAVLLAESISSLSLVCTAAAIENTTSFAENMAQRASLILPKSVDRTVADAARRIFAPSWLELPDDVHLPDPATTPNCNPPAVATTTASEGSEGKGRKVEQENSGRYLKFESNAQRFVAQEMHKRLDPAGRFTIRGFLLQLIAAGWHHKSPAQLSDMADRVGRDRILVMHGTEDGMISVHHGRKLIEYMRPGKGFIVEGMGHAPLVERWEWFNGVIEEQCRLGERSDGRE